MQPRGPGSWWVLLVFAALVLTPQCGSAQDRSPSAELQAWLAGGRGAERYRGIAEQLMGIAVDLDREGLPGGLLMGRIREGAAKAVPPERLLEAAVAEAGRLKELAALLEAIGPDPGSDAERVYGILSLCLRGGMPTGTLAALLRAGSLTTDRLERTLAAAQTILALSGRRRTMARLIGPTSAPRPRMV